MAKRINAKNILFDTKRRGWEKGKPVKMFGFEPVQTRYSLEI
jgi:hypothetical protein